jgi:hypothetical protein
MNVQMIQFNLNLIKPNHIIEYSLYMHLIESYERSKQLKFMSRLKSTKSDLSTAFNFSLLFDKKMKLEAKPFIYEFI